MYQRLLPQGRLAIKWMTPFYLLPKLRMYGVLLLLPHTLAGCSVISEHYYLYNLPCKWCYNVYYW
jgi:hypothetical protein